MIRTLLLALAFAVCGAPAFAQSAPDYWFVGVSATTSEEINTVTFVDANSIETDGQVRRARATAFLQNHPSHVEHIEALMEFNCADRTVRTLTATVYFEDSSPASLSSPETWSPARDNTAAAWQLDFACGSRDPAQYIQVRNDLTLAQSARGMFEILARRGGGRSK